VLCELSAYHFLLWLDKHFRTYASDWSEKPQLANLPVLEWRERNSTIHESITSRANKGLAPDIV